MSDRSDLSLTVPADLVERVADLVAERVAELVADRLDGDPAQQEPPRLLSTAEAAAWFGRSERWVRDRKKDGTLPWVRLDGGPSAFRLEDLRAFAEARRIACDPTTDGRAKLNGGRDGEESATDPPAGPPKDVV